MNWWVWRVATHERTKAGLYEIETQWSLADLARAHMACDIFDELHRRSAELARQDRPGRRR